MHCAVRARKAVQTRNWGSDYAVASKAGALPAWSRVPPVVAPGACGESDRSCHQGYSIEEVVIRVRKPALMLSRCLEATVRVFKHVVCACVRVCACVCPHQGHVVKVPGVINSLEVVDPRNSYRVRTVCSVKCRGRTVSGRQRGQRGNNAGIVAMCGGGGSGWVPRGAAGTGKMDISTIETAVTTVR